MNQFFDPDAVVEKDEWRWDDEKGTIINPLSKELDGLEAIDKDYDFSVAQEEAAPKAKENDGAEAPKTSEENAATTPKIQTAEELALSRMNMIVTGGSVDSVSTMGNPLSPPNLRNMRASMLLPANATPSGNSTVCLLYTSPRPRD